MNEPRLPVDDVSPFANLLRQAVLLKDKIDALASASGENFNIFTILDRETNEVKTHSTIIADLLNPGGMHGQGEVFALLLLEQLKVEIHGDLHHAGVGVEVDAGEHGRIDIMFEMDDSCVVMENKVYASAQPRQLERYHRYATTRFADDRIELLYLTLHGTKPDEESLGLLPPQKVRCISYESDIIKWLDACIKEVARIPQIRELLVQYQNLLRRLTGIHDGNLTMMLDAILKEKQGETYNFELVPPLVDALNAMRIEVEWWFWEDLRARLEGGREKESRAWCLETLSIDGVLDATEENIKSTRTRSSNRPWRYGWTFRVLPDHDFLLKESSEILLRIEHEGWSSSVSKVFFGLLLAEQAKDKLQSDKFGPEFSDGAEELNMEPNPETANSWLGWRYPNQEISFLPETLVKGGLMRRLITKCKREAVIEAFAADVEKVVEGIMESWFRTGQAAK